MIRNIFYSRLVVVCANSTLSRESRKASGRVGSGGAAYRETHAAGDRVNPPYSFALFIPRCLNAPQNLAFFSPRTQNGIGFAGGPACINFSSPKLISCRPTPKL